MCANIVAQTARLWVGVDVIHLTIGGARSRASVVPGAVVVPDAVGADVLGNLLRRWRP
jgi:hypothetical protein